MKLHLTTITPLHIGNGEALYPLDYVKDDVNRIYFRISQKQFLTFAAPIPDAIEQYTKWIDDITKSIEDTDAIKEQAYKKKGDDFNKLLARLPKEFNLLTFVKRFKKEKEFIAYLNSLSDVIKIPFDESPKAQIRGVIKTAFNDPYLPGTSLKGAIRSALLYAFLAKQPSSDKAHTIIKDKVKKIKDDVGKARKLQNKGLKQELDKHKTKFAAELEQWGFYCGTKAEDKPEISCSDEKFDLMKLLTISDGQLDNKANSLVLANVDLYLVRKDVKSGGFEGDIQKGAPTLEAIQAGQSITCQLNFNIEFLYSIKDKLLEDAIPVGKEKHWIGITNKVQQLFNLSIADLTRENLAEKKTEVLNYVLDCVNTFSRRQLVADREWLTYFKEHDPRDKHSRKMATGYQIVFDKKQTTLVRVGYASGFNAMTELLYLLDNPSLKSLYKEVMEMFKIGDKPGAQNKRKDGQSYQANPDKFPKSRRLITQKGRITPLGWLELMTETQLAEEQANRLAIEENARKEAEEAKKPKYFSGKIEPGKTIVDAEVIWQDRMNPKKKKFKLLLADPHKEQEIDCSHAGSLLGEIYRVKIGLLDKKSGKVQMIEVREKKG